MSDKDKLVDIRRHWAATLDHCEEKHPNSAAAVLALWATLNVDTLIGIADRALSKVREL